MTHPRQPAYDAVFDVIRNTPPIAPHPDSQAAENARVWRAVTAALDAMGIADAEAPAASRERAEHGRVGTNSGHGHAWERPDGAKARCGGPGICAECFHDKRLAEAMR